jgi:hypothetical protein
MMTHPIFVSSPLKKEKKPCSSGTLIIERKERRNKNVSFHRIKQQLGIFHLKANLKNQFILVEKRNCILFIFSNLEKNNRKFQ